jgi:hypothetical protein
MSSQKEMLFQRPISEKVCLLLVYSFSSIHMSKKEHKCHPNAVNLIIKKQNLCILSVLKSKR